MPTKETTQVIIAFDDIASVYFQVTRDTEREAKEDNDWVFWRKLGAGSLMTVDRQCYKFVAHQLVSNGVLLEVLPNEY